MALALYRDRFSHMGLEVVMLDDHEQVEFMALLYRIKQGDVGPASRETMAALAHRLVGKGAQSVVAGCTEVPLVLSAATCRSRSWMRRKNWPSAAWPCAWKSLRSVIDRPSLVIRGLEQPQQGGRAARGLGHAQQRRAGVSVVGDLGLALETFGFAQVVVSVPHAANVYRR
jgi:hypothetical protein